MLSKTGYALNHLIDLYKEFESQSVSLPGLPPSANTAWKPNGRGGRIYSPEYRCYIDMARIAARHLKSWNPKGPLAMVLVLQSPRFMTKPKSKRDVPRPSLSMDLDNRIKTVIDALHGGRRSSGVLSVDDALYWNIHAFKVASETAENTMVRIYDLSKMRQEPKP